MNKIAVYILAFVLIQIRLLAGDEKTVVPAVLKSATVYRAGAELTHIAKAILKQGNNDLLIEGLSNGLDINSVQIGTDEKLTILSIEFSTDYLKPAVKSAAIKRLEDSLETINKETANIQVVVRTDNELLDLLKANREIRGTQTGVSVAELMKMMDYYKTKTLEVQNEIAQYQEKQNRLNELAQKINRQINEESQKNNKTVGKLMLQVVSPLAGNCNLTISYITAKAYWNPSYDIRIENISKPISLLYKAKLVQTTGIDWKQVKLTLATSTPNQNNNAPVLKSWFLDYTNPVTKMENNLYMNSMQSMLQGRVPGLDANKELSEVVVVGYAKNKKDEEDDEDKISIRGNSSLQKSLTPLYVLNGNVISQQQFQKIDPKNIKSMDVLKDANATAVYGARAANGAILVTLKDELGDYITVKDNELNVSFDIDLPYDVPGNGKEQNVSLKEFQVNTLYKYYAVPKLDKDAYLLGEIADWEGLNLLPGEANIIFEGTYTGKSYIDPNSTMDTLNLTLGKDKRIVVKKEKLKDYSSVKFLGSNKKQVFTYEITVKNNKKEAIQMLLKDQYPLSTNKDIEVELLESPEASNNTELGVLTWKLQLAAGEVKKLRVSYSVKYPKDKYVNL
ncbi:MAG: mucoidy inhibitor MuiA family protein [Chitinophagaceae bacterium]